VLVLVVLVGVVQDLQLVMEPQELQIPEVVEAAPALLVLKLVDPVVQVSSSFVIRSVNSRSKQLVEQFLILVERLYTLLLHQRPLLLLIHL
jgi:hypothetical protein